MAKRIDWVLLGACVASTFAHFLVIAGPGWVLPDWKEDRAARIEARLITPAPLTAQAAELASGIMPTEAATRLPKPRPKPAPKPKPKPAQPAVTLGSPPAAEPAAVPEPLAAQEPAAAAEPAPVEDAPAAAAASSEPPPAPEKAGSEPVVASQDTNGKEENLTEAAADEDLADNRFPGPIPLPREARIAFSLILGRIQVGEALQTWSRDERGYRLRIVMETTGAARMFKALTITQTSAGGFYSGGLRPRSFSYEQTGRATSNTVFDWKQMKLTLARGDNHREFPLEVGAQDLLSLAYQLALAGNGARQTQIAVASGKNYYSNALEWPGEDTVSTPAGEVRALRVRTAGQDTTTEIWLAPDLQNLPVRITFTDRNGTATQLVATQVMADGRMLLGKTKQAQ